MSEQNQSDEGTKKVLDAILIELKKQTSDKRFGFTIRFVEGIFYGLGATVGLAIIVAVFSFAASIFGGIPVIGNILISLGRMLHNGQ